MIKNYLFSELIFQKVKIRKYLAFNFFINLKFYYERNYLDYYYDPNKYSNEESNDSDLLEILKFRR